MGQPIEVLEKRFDSTRTLDVDPRTRRFLLDHAASLDLAEVLVTDGYGYNAITTERTSDFVQSDEAWWQQAKSTGLSPSEATYDQSAKLVSISVASAVRAGESAPAVGVMKVVYGLAALQRAVHDAATAGIIVVEMIDSAGRMIVSSDRLADLKPMPGQDGLPRAATVVRYNDGTVQRAAVRTTNRNKWRVVSHMAESIPLAEVRTSGYRAGRRRTGGLSAAPGRARPGEWIHDPAHRDAGGPAGGRVGIGRGGRFVDQPAPLHRRRRDRSVGTGHQRR